MQGFCDSAIRPTPRSQHILFWAKCGSPGRHRQACKGLDSRDIPGAVLTPSGDSQNQLLQERSAAAPQQGSGAEKEREEGGVGGRGEGG